MLLWEENYLNINQFLNVVCTQIRYRPARNEIANELKAHLLEIKDELLAQGIEESIAEENAVQRMGKAEEIGKQLNKIHRPRINWILIIVTAIFIFLGVVNLINKQIITHNGYIGKIFKYIILGIGAGVIVYLLDYKKIKKYSWHIYIIATLVMLLTFMGVGYKINERIYIRIFSIYFSPSEIAVPLYLISFAGYMTDINSKKALNQVLKILLLEVMPLILLKIGCSIEGIAILSIAYFIYGCEIILHTEDKVKRKYTVFCLILLIGILSFSKSIMVDTNNISVEDKKMAIIKNDIMKNSKFVGETETSCFKENELFICGQSNYTFLYIIRKMGILFGMILIILIVVIIATIIYILRNIKDVYGKYLVIGAGVSLIFELTTNVIMNVSDNVIFKVNFPFLTDGLIYFVINCICIAIILAVYRRKDIYMYNNCEYQNK